MNAQAVASGRLSRFGNPQLVFVVDAEFAAAVSQTRWSSTRYGYLESVEPGTKKKLWLHRFVWFLKHGWCPRIIDHINGVKWDCRIENLRAASASLNSRNRRIARKHDLPVGVRVLSGRKPGSRRFQARIKVNGSDVHLGSFFTPEEASRVYQEAYRKVASIESEQATREALHGTAACRSVGDNEYLAAINGISDQTISPRSLNGYAIGDQICFRLKVWKGNVFKAGRIAAINEARGTLLVEANDGIVEVVAGEVGKGGEVLPF